MRRTNWSRLSRAGATAGLILLVACTGVEGGDPPLTDGGSDCYSAPAGCIDPAGAVHRYVVDSVRLPSSAAEARSVGLDLDDAASGGVDNRLGTVLSALAGAGSLDLQGTVDTQIAAGAGIVLVEVQAVDLAGARGAGARALLGDNPVPAPCADESDADCGRHLDGSGRFDAREPALLEIAGAIAASKLRAGPTEVTFDLEIEDLLPRPLPLRFVGARVHSTLSESGVVDGIIGAALPVEDVRREALPMLVDLVARDCGGTAPDCCTPDSVGAAILSVLDTADECALTLDDLEQSGLVDLVLMPDVDLLDASGAFAPGSDGVADSISLGIGFTAVGAEF